MGTMIDFPEHDLTAYRADPTGEPRGAVVVIQEIWGLADHIKDVTDRFAAQGYVAVAPDLLGHVGLTPEVGARIFGAHVQRVGGGPPRCATADARGDDPGAAAGVRRVGGAGPAGRRRRRSSTSRVWQGGWASSASASGGRIAFALAAADPRLRAAVPFYGSFPETADPATIGCPVLAFYGEGDHGITDGVPELESAHGAGRRRLTARVYHGVGHAFFNDTSPSRYNAEVAGRRMGAGPGLFRQAPDRWVEP